ncbi:MAG TPA: hypothetical protein VKP30_18460 [Polyangiaceae bacterium]|nr:hypothetical protein [Polyangiaceae bacterium]
MTVVRAFGVGVVIATQNPTDLDYRALSNAGRWCIGRLQTDAARDRVLDGLSVATTTDSDAKEKEHTIARLAPRWFTVRSVHGADAVPILAKPRNTWSMMRGPLTCGELRQVPRWKEGKPSAEVQTSCTGVTRSTERGWGADRD